MKNLAYILIALLSVTFLNSCKDEPTPEGVVFEDALKLNSVFQTKSNSIKLTISEINDSRCPSDVVCVWQGMVVVKISADLPEKKVLSLNSYNNQADTIGHFEIRLIDVLPYPVSTKVIKLEDYEVKLKVTEL